MKKTILALATAATVAMGVVAAPETADARSRWWPGAVIGGLAAGAIIGGAVANRGYYGDPYAYDSYAYYGDSYYGAPYAPGGGPYIWGGGRVYSGPYGAYGAYGTYGVAPNDKYGHRNDPAP